MADVRIPVFPATPQVVENLRHGHPRVVGMIPAMQTDREIPGGHDEEPDLLIVPESFHLNRDGMDFPFRDNELVSLHQESDIACEADVVISEGVVGHWSQSVPQIARKLTFADLSLCTKR